MTHVGAQGWRGAAPAWWLAAGLVVAVLLAPLLLVQAPPLLDYLNHLARAAVLAAPDDAALARMVVPHWTIIPNLLLDATLPPLFHVASPMIAGRIVAGMVLLLPVAGALAYSRAVFGRRSYWPLGACLVAYNATFLLGFLGFLAAIGLAMLLAAAWIVRRDAHPAACVALGALAAIGLFFCHLMGVALFLVLVFAFELERAWRHPRTALRRLLAALLLPLGPLVLYLLSPFQQVTQQTLWMTPQDKLLQLLTPFAGYDATLDALTAAVVGLGLLGLALGGRLRVTLQGGIALATLLALYAVAPFIFKGTCFLDTRFAIMLGYLLFAAVLPVGLSGRARGLVALAGAALFAARVATVGLAWHGSAQDLDDMRAVIAPVQPGERVFVVGVAPEEAPGYWRHAPRYRRLASGVRLDYHLPALLVLERHAFWPYLFADPAQQPVALVEPYARLAREAGPLLAHRQFDAGGSRALCDYDYVLLLGAGGEPDLARYGGERLSLLQARDVAALYRVRPPADAALCAAWQVSAVVP